MVSWSTFSTCHVFFALLLPLLSLAGSEGNAGTTSEIMCPTTATATTTVGVSLVQSLSLNRRIPSGDVKEAMNQLEQKVRDAKLLNVGPSEMANGTQQGGEAPSGVVSAAQEEDTYSTGDAARKVVDDAFEGLQRGARHFSDIASMLRQDVVKVVTDSRHRRYPLSQEAKRSAGVLILLVLFVLVIGVVVVFLARPEPDNVKFSQFDRRGGNSPQMGMAASGSPGPGTGRYLPDPQAGSRMGSGFGPSPRSAHTLPRRTNSADSSEEESARREFCPDLVVPEQCECILVVPVHAPWGKFSICDMNRRAVLHAFTQTTGPGAPWQLNLQTAAGEDLAHCGEVRRKSDGSVYRGSSASDAVEFHILDAKAEFFARLVQIQGQQRFELQTKDGKRLQFWGNFQTQAVNVTDEQGGLLATTEPEQLNQDNFPCYRLRVAPLANVGHSLCALLCIGQVLPELVTRGSTVK